MGIEVATVAGEGGSRGGGIGRRENEKGKERESVCFFKKNLYILV